MKVVFICDPLKNTPSKPWVTYGENSQLNFLGINGPALTSTFSTDSTATNLSTVNRTVALTLTERIARDVMSEIDRTLIDTINQAIAADSSATYTRGEDESEIISLSESEPDGPTKLGFSKYQQVIFDGVAFTT